MSHKSSKYGCTSFPSHCFHPTYITYNTTSFIRKLCKHWEAVKLTVVVLIFQNSGFFLERTNFIICNNTVSCYPWSARLTLFIFKKTPVKYLGRNKQVFYHSLRVTWVQLTLGCWSAFPWANYPISVCDRKSCVLPTHYRKCSRSQI